MNREELVQKTEQWIINEGYRISQKDTQRPWGAFWHIHPQDREAFVHRFFYGRTLFTENFISPKILLILPHQRLSLQIHRKRSECWTIIQGPVDIVLRTTQQTYYSTEQIDIPVNTLHRLTGLEEPAIVAEIWIHRDLQNPSDEDDIERWEDDYQRK